MIELLPGVIAGLIIGAAGIAYSHITYLAGFNAAMRQKGGLR